MKKPKPQQKTRKVFTYIDYEYDKKCNIYIERYEEVFGKLDENYANNLYTESDIDLFAENSQVTITSSSIDYEEWLK